MCVEDGGVPRCFRRECGGEFGRVPPSGEIALQGEARHMQSAPGQEYVVDPGCSFAAAEQQVDLDSSDRLCGPENAGRVGPVVGAARPRRRFGPPWCSVFVEHVQVDGVVSSTEDGVAFAPPADDDRSLVRLLVFEDLDQAASAVGAVGDQFHAGVPRALLGRVHCWGAVIGLPPIGQLAGSAVEGPVSEAGGCCVHSRHE